MRSISTWAEDRPIFAGRFFELPFVFSFFYVRKKAQHICDPLYIGLFIFNPGPVVNDPQNIVKDKGELMIGKRVFLKRLDQAFYNILFQDLF